MATKRKTPNTPAPAVRSKPKAAPGRAKPVGALRAPAAPRPAAKKPAASKAAPYQLVVNETPVDTGVRSFDEVIDRVRAPFESVDPVGFTKSLRDATAAAVRHPLALSGALARLGAGAVAATLAVGNRALGTTTPGPVKPQAKDQRFADPAWDTNPLYFALMQSYLLADRLAMDVLDAADLDEVADRKARFAARFIIDLAAPTNTLAGNPAALKRAFETGGQSAVRGLRNFLHDLRENDGWPTQVDASGFEVGVNMATTPGKVVYTNGLIELIEYAPQTEQVYEVPLLFCPPWINKYYIMDLAPGRSLIEWAVQHGHRAFAISYRNPDVSMRDLGFDDYLLGGPLDAVRVVRAITGAPRVNTVSVCLGGQLTAMAMAYGAATGDDSINCATLINTHTDYTHPGLLGAFTDETAIECLERRMAKKGYLDAGDMAKTFNGLRANDLIFSYVVNNWLLGKTPPAFDLLAWNNDSTNMPERMHSRYLRSCYLRNEFARGEFVANGHRLDPGAVTQDTFVLSAIDDHIVPWISAYKTTQLLGGDNTFVLSTSGHIAGIVNPPNPKAKHWVNPDCPPDTDGWLAGATLRDNTWWHTWTPWIAARAGKLVAPPTGFGSAEYPALGDAPGTFVRGRAR